MVTTCTFEAIPRTVISGGSVRFFPIVSGNTLPIVSYAWTFGDTGTSTDATPTHTYTSAVNVDYDVALTVTDANGGTATLTRTDFITVDVSANVPDIPTDGTHQKTSVFITDDTNSMLVNRTQYGVKQYNVTEDILHPHSSVKLALDFEDAAFVDTSLYGHTITMNGGIARSSTQKHHGSYSAYFDGVDDYLSIADSDDWNFGSGDFAISVQIYLTVNSSGPIFYQWNGATETDGFSLGYNSGIGTGYIDFIVRISDVIVGIVDASNVGFTLNAWHQIVITRDSDSLHIYFDGSLKGNGSITGAMPNIATPVLIGKNTNGSSIIKGYLDELFVVKGYHMNVNGQVVVPDYTSAHLNLLKPKVVTFIDSSPTTTFSLLDTGSATATEKGLIVEGSKVKVIMGNHIVFSGVIRRVTQNMTSGYTSDTRVKLWDIECDSDLMLLKKDEVESSVLDSYGEKIYNTPGYIARTILTPGSGEWDWRGAICCNDTKITYQLNSSTAAESVGSKYDHIIALQQKTNYDLIVYPYYEVYAYTNYNGAVLTCTHNYGVDELIGYTVFIPAQAGASGCLGYGTITDNDTTTITVALNNWDYMSTTSGYCIISFGSKIDFAPDLSTQSSVVTYNQNQDVFNYSDNDDKNKFCSKVVVKGKDTIGKSISVSLSGVHVYEESRQYYNDSTHITLKSEGYVYKNNWIAKEDRIINIKAIYAEKLNVDSTANYGTDPNKILMSAGDSADFHLHELVFFTGTLPAALNYSTFYHIVDVGSGYIKVSTTYGGSPVDLLDSGGSFHTHTPGGILIDNTDGYVPYTSAWYIGWSIGGVTDYTTYYNINSTSATDNYMFTPGTAPLIATGNRVNITSVPTTACYLFKESSNVGNFSEVGQIPGILLYGWNYAIKDGDSIALVTPHGTAESATVDSTPLEDIDSKGIPYTYFTLTALPFSDYSDKGYLLNQRLYVEDYSQVGNNEVLVGEEKITVASSGNDTSYGNYIQFADVTARITSASLKCYPHGVGALVARTNYTEASPETGSAIKDYGIIVDTEIVDTTTTYGDLDTYATMLLLGHGSFYRKATCWGLINKIGVERVGLINQSNISSPPRIGDTITIDPSDTEDTIDYEIVKVTLDIDGGRIELELGDYEKNMFTSLLQKTFAINTTLS